MSGASDDKPDPAWAQPAKGLAGLQKGLIGAQERNLSNQSRTGNSVTFPNLLFQIIWQMSQLKFIALNAVTLLLGIVLYCIISF